MEDEMTEQETRRDRKSEPTKEMEIELISREEDEEKEVLKEDNKNNEHNCKEVWRIICERTRRGDG